MPEEVTTAEPTTAIDPDVWDPERAMNTIVKMRDGEKLSKQRIRALEDGYRALSKGLPVDPALVANESDSEVANLKSAFTDISVVLGVEFSGDPAPLLAAARAAAISGPLALATAKAGVDHGLTAALLGQSGALASLDLGGDVSAQLANAIRSIKDEHPNVAVRASVPAVSSFPIGAGSNGAPALPVSREALAFLAPAEVDRLRKAGGLSHLDIGADK